MPAQERELLQELKGLEQRVLAEERESNYTGASLAAEEERTPLLSRRRARGRALEGWTYWRRPAGQAGSTVSRPCDAHLACPTSASVLPRRPVQRLAPPGRAAWRSCALGASGCQARRAGRRAGRRQRPSRGPCFARQAQQRSALRVDARPARARGGGVLLAAAHARRAAVHRPAAVLPALRLAAAVLWALMMKHCSLPHLFLARFWGTHVNSWKSAHMPGPGATLRTAGHVPQNSSRKWWAAPARARRCAAREARGRARRPALHELFVHLNGLLEFIDINRDGFRKALKKHDKVLGGLPHHSRLQPEYLPKVDEKFADKNRPHLQARALAACRRQGVCGVLAEPLAPVACSAMPCWGAVLGKHMRACAVLRWRAGLRHTASPGGARAPEGGHAAAGGADAGGEPVRGRVLQRQHRARGARAAAAAARPCRL